MIVASGVFLVIAAALVDAYIAVDRFYGAKADRLRRQAAVGRHAESE